MKHEHESPDAFDARLRTDVLHTLDEHPDVSSPHIGVAVADHVVTLSGTVPSDADRTAAIRATRGVAGLLTMVDDIVVVDEKRADSTEHEIALAAEHELAQVVDEMPTVQATVRGRVVTLTGVVDDTRHKHTLMFAIRDIPGVSWVEDQMVDRQRALHNRVRVALGPPNLADVDQLHIRASGSDVWVSGSTSQAIRDGAEEVLSLAPGVEVVHDQVTDPIEGTKSPQEIDQ